MSESQFRSSLIKNAAANTLAQAIESTTGSGIPDLFYCHNGRPCWIELKYLKNDEIRMRNSQFAWFRRLYKAQGMGLLLIKRTRNGRLVCHEGYDIDRLMQPEVYKEAMRKGQDIIFPKMNPTVYGSSDATYKQVLTRINFWLKAKENKRVKKGKEKCEERLVQELSLYQS